MVTLRLVSQLHKGIEAPGFFILLDKPQYSGSFTHGYKMAAALLGIVAPFQA